MSKYDKQVVFVGAQTELSSFGRLSAVLLLFFYLPVYYYSISID